MKKIEIRLKTEENEMDRKLYEVWKRFKEKAREKGMIPKALLYKVIKKYLEEE